MPTGHVRPGNAPVVEERVDQMLHNENDFRQPVTIDIAPAGETCEWCGKPAVQQLTALGGMHHNDGGFFCRQCGEAFVRAVASSLSREVRAEAEATVR